MNQHQLCFETLANELRLSIIRSLEQGARNVTELAEATKAERSRVSHALQMLRECRIVSAKRHGREIRYALNTESPVFKEGTGSLLTLITRHAQQSCATCHKHGRRPEFT